MVANKNQKDALFYIRLVLISIFASIIGGSTMALLNLLIEFLKSNSVFRFADLFLISLSHMLIWSIFGTIAGIIWAIYSFFRKKVTSISLFDIILYYTFISAWLIFISYINIIILPLAFSKTSLTWNSILLIIGIILFILLIKYLKKVDVRKVPLFMKFYFAFLVIIHLSSFMVNQGLFQGKNTSTQINKSNDTSNLNVIIILLDAVRHDHLGCYGYERQTSPNIDNLAAKGVIFENAFSQSSRTHESVPSLFTSTYSCSHNVNTLTKALPKDLFTISQIFKLNGYITSIFSTNPNVTPIRGFNKGVNDFFGVQANIKYYTLLYHLLRKPIGLRIPLFCWGIKQVLSLSDSLFQDKNSIKSEDPVHVTQKVIFWISQNKKNPFFIYIHYPGGHAVYRPPAPYNKVFDPSFTGEPIDWYPRNLGMFLPFVKGNPMNPRELENMIAQYDGEILYHDDQLGELFRYLKEVKIEDKTLLVITADHGEEFYEHEGWGHGHSLFDEVIHVPLIFYCPGLIPPGKKIDGLAGVIDIFPTIVSLCGLKENFKLPYRIDGVDMSEAILSGSSKKTREFVLSEVGHGGGSHWAKCLRSKKYKAIITKYSGKTLKSLFNLVSDPFEQDNIFDIELQTGKKYFRKLESIVNQSYKFKAQKKALDERTKDKLRSLGYIN